MTVAGLHPEELFDKLSAGTLSAAERERLNAHVAQCKACRFELVARRDFFEELNASPRSALHAQLFRALPAQRDSEVPRRRRGPKFSAIGVAMLVIAVAGVAAAISGGLPWQPKPARAPAVTGSASKAVAVRSGASRQKLMEAASDELEPPAPTVPVPPPAPSSRAEPERRVSASAAGRAAPRAVAARPGSKVGRTESASAAGTTPAALFAAANRARRQGDPTAARDLYRELQEQFPTSHEANLSRVTLATMQLDSGRPAAALADFDRYLAGGARALEAEALVGKALSLKSLGNREAERAAWQEVIRRYPGSAYAKRAAQRLAALGRF
jgi:TolA-binding protein